MRSAPAPLSRVIIASLFYAMAMLLPRWAFAEVPACQGYTGIASQTNPPTDATGLANTNFPEASSTTYFGTMLSGSSSTQVTVHGQYPLARFMSLELYSGDQLVDFIADASIQPDPGQNNPFVSGTAQGTFTVHVIFGPKPSPPATNTIYAGTLTSVAMMYRLYHTTDPNDPAGSATNPVTPEIYKNGKLLSNCPVQPILPADSTPWDRLDLIDWAGALPSGSQVMSAFATPPWVLVNPSTAHFFPNGADYYMTALLSRQFLAPNTADNIFVIQFLAPTFPNTRSGEPVYENRQVRFWSMCTDDPYTTGVTRCVPDDAVSLDANGNATFVISDPGSAPTPASLTQFHATWIAWGALDSSADVVYDRNQQPWGTNTPVFYYNHLLYRQTLASPSFTQSMVNTAVLPRNQQRAAMGSYWPVSGYCATADFQLHGVGCIKN